MMPREDRDGVEGQTAKGWLELGPGFIRRVMITTTWLGLISSLCLAGYLGPGKAAAWAVGVVLGLADLFLLDTLIREAIGRRRRSVLVVCFVLKFAVLYLAGAVALFWLRLQPYYLIGGFSLFLLVTFLKIVGRLLLSTRWMLVERRGPGGRLLRDGPGRGSGGS